MCFKFLYWYFNFKIVIKNYFYFFVFYFKNVVKICLMFNQNNSKIYVLLMLLKYFYVDFDGVVCNLSNEYCRRLQLFEMELNKNLLQSV